jgi:hypothetical protein
MIPVEIPYRVSIVKNGRGFFERDAVFALVGAALERAPRKSETVAPYVIHTVYGV